LADEKIDVTISGMVPEHEILAKGKEAELLATFGIDREKLPKIKVTDPQCKNLGAKVGDIIKITRKDTCTNLAYRLVVK